MALMGGGSINSNSGGMLQNLLGGINVSAGGSALNLGGDAPTHGGGFSGG